MKKIFLTGLLCLNFTVIGSAVGKEVVVIPLAGDDTAQQYVKTTENTTNASEGCISQIYFTHKTKVTQVKAITSSSILLVSDEVQWYATPQYRKNLGSWLLFPDSQAAYSGGSAGQYSSSTNTKMMELDPDSNYQFRVDYRLEPAHSTSYCNLMLEFSFKTDNIVEPFVFIPM